MFLLYFYTYFSELGFRVSMHTHASCMHMHTSSMRMCTTKLHTHAQCMHAHTFTQNPNLDLVCFFSLLYLFNMLPHPILCL